MPSINELNVNIYLLAAVAVIFLGTKFSTPGAARVFTFATLFSVFFSMGLLGGHGVMPFPGIWILSSCWYADSCSEMYDGTSGLFLFTLLPMLVQWMIVLAVSFVTYYVYKRMGFDQPTPNETNEKTNRHKRIIGIAWTVVGVAFLLIIILSIGYLYLKGETVVTKQLFPIRTFFALLQISAGYSLLKNLSWAHWLCFPLSILSLLSIPIGTALGGYYLWYYFTIERKI